jgi:tRNA threonylcarbamoyl adenosine modification protein YjeE
MDEVPSPTFTLLQTYEAQEYPIYHFDFYRLEDAEELEELGWDDARAEGVVLVEWPQQAEIHLPQDYLALNFIHDKKSRRVEITPYGNWKGRLKGALK